MTSALVNFYGVLNSFRTCRHMLLLSAKLGFCGSMKQTKLEHLLFMWQQQYNILSFRDSWASDKNHSEQLEWFYLMFLTHRVQCKLCVYVTLSKMQRTTLLTQEWWDPASSALLCFHDVKKRGYWLSNLIYKIFSLFVIIKYI